jgi:hypothetical protein
LPHGSSRGRAASHEEQLREALGELELADAFGPVQQQRVRRPLGEAREPLPGFLLKRRNRHGDFEIQVALQLVADLLDRSAAVDAP